jgi:ectoine hydroxylase
MTPPAAGAASLGLDPACLAHRLTAGERRTFEETGLLILPGVLDADRVAALTELTDDIWREALSSGHPEHEALFYPNFIPRSSLFQDLVDEPRTLPKVWGLLGWNIYLYHAHLIVTPPSGKPRDGKTFGWHQDSARVNVEIETRPRPRLSLKVAYFLSDCSEEGRGNFWVIPASHLWDDLAMPPGGMGQPAGATPVLVKPGDAVIFDRRLWHAGTPNWSDVTRKVLFYGYGYRWLRTKDDMTVQDLWPSSSPIRRQLLGDAVNANGRYKPTDGDVPLRVWLRAYSPEEAR